MAGRRTAKPAVHAPHAASIQVGYWAAVSLCPDAAPLRCYVGQVDAVDQRGIRLTLVDWLSGTPSGWDLFAPWEQITSMLVATPDHDVQSFGEATSTWQTKMNGLSNPSPTERTPEAPAHG
jgi:hypothetical protein